MQFETYNTHISKAKFLYKSAQYQPCLSEIEAAKPYFVQLRSFFQPENLRTEIAHEAHIVRDTYELECLCHARLGNCEGFQSTYSCLRFYYTTAFSAVVSQSEKQLLITGLHLLALLIENRTGEFNAELELLSPDALASIYIQPVIELERYLMDGCYTKVLQARNTVPTNDYEVLFQRLTERMTHIVAESIAASCDKISASAALHLLSIGGDAELAKNALEALCKKGIVLEHEESVTRATAGHTYPDAVLYDSILSQSILHARDTHRIV